MSQAAAALRAFVGAGGGGLKARATTLSDASLDSGFQSCPTSPTSTEGADGRAHSFPAASSMPPTPGASGSTSCGAAEARATKPAVMAESSPSSPTASKATASKATAQPDETCGQSAETADAVCLREVSRQLSRRTSRIMAAGRNAIPIGGESLHEAHCDLSSSSSASAEVVFLGSEHGANALNVEPCPHELDPIALTEVKREHAALAKAVESMVAYAAEAVARAEAAEAALEQKRRELNSSPLGLEDLDDDDVRLAIRAAVRDAVDDATVELREALAELRRARGRQKLDS